MLRLLARLVGVPVAFIGFLGCEAPLPGWDPQSAASDGAAPDAPGEARLTFDPPADSNAVTRVTRIEVELGRAVGSPRVLLLEGALTSAQLHDLARPAITQTLAARARSTVVWTSSGTTLSVAPLESLAPGTLYTIGVSEPLVALSFTVAADDGLVLLQRSWPDPQDTGAPSKAAVWCGRDALTVEDTAVTLSPAAITGRLQRGTGGFAPADHCISWLPQGHTSAIATEAPALPAVTPPSQKLAFGSTALLEPILLWPGADVPRPAPLTCFADEVRFGPGCAAVDDDRIVVRPPAAPLLWTIETGAGSVVRRSRAERPFVVRPLPDEDRFRITVLDASGIPTDDVIAVEPAPPRAHVVINEVMANPAGMERAQEWVELFNDGLSPVAIGGFTLETGGGSATLPTALLAPGAFALVVTEGYLDDDGVDPVAAPGTLLLRVPALGRDGLSNDGESLLLRDASGAVLSTFPAMKTKNGVSNARVAPDALDGDPDAFLPSPNGRATPGAPNASAPP